MTFQFYAPTYIVLDRDKLKRDERQNKLGGREEGIDPTLIRPPYFMTKTTLLFPKRVQFDLSRNLEEKIRKKPSKR